MFYENCSSPRYFFSKSELYFYTFLNSPSGSSSDSSSSSKIYSWWDSRLLFSRSHSLYEHYSPIIKEDDWFWIFSLNKLLSSNDMLRAFFFEADSLPYEFLLFNDLISSTMISLIQLFWPLIWSIDLEKGIWKPKILASMKLSWISLWVALYPLNIYCLISFISFF